jgi:hypothetical protein
LIVPVRDGHELLGLGVVVWVICGVSEGILPVGSWMDGEGVTVTEGVVETGAWISLGALAQEANNIDTINKNATATAKHGRGTTIRRRESAYEIMRCARR